MTHTDHMTTDFHDAFLAAARMVREDLYAYTKRATHRQRDITRVSTADDLRVLAGILPWIEWSEVASAYRHVLLGDVFISDATLDLIERARRHLHGLEDPSVPFPDRA